MSNNLDRQDLSCRKRLGGGQASRDDVPRNLWAFVLSSSHAMAYIVLIDGVSCALDGGLDCVGDNVDIVGLDGGDRTVERDSSRLDKVLIDLARGAYKIGPGLIRESLPVLDSYLKLQ